MKVSKAIEMLSSYDPNEEIFIAYWDKEYVETGIKHIFNGEPVPEEVWRKATEIAHDKTTWAELAGEALCDSVAEAYEAYKEKENA